MRRPDSGRSHLWPIVELVLLAAIGFIAVQAVPVYLRNHKLTQHLRQLAGRTDAQRSKADAVQNDVVAYARNLELPVRRENVRVETLGNRLAIQLDYDVPIDLRICTWVLHFEPSTGD